MLWYMDLPLSNWGSGLAPFQLGTWTGPFPVGDIDRPLSSWGYGLARFRLGFVQANMNGWQSNWQKEQDV